MKKYPATNIRYRDEIMFLPGHQFDSTRVASSLLKT
jgi:hypothetical protein